MQSTKCQYESFPISKIILDIGFKGKVLVIESYVSWDYHKMLIEIGNLISEAIPERAKGIQNIAI